MEINLKTLSEQKAMSTTNETKMRLSEDAQSMVFQLFTKNVYSNPIGTVVREITSNCFDSHIEAKVNPPVLIKKFTDKQTETEYISFIDYGVGMSPDRVQNIYGVYFESTKRVDNTQIGGFGIGGKTPLAYKRSTGNGEGEYDNSFYVITISDGIKYYYCIYEGQESPVISLLHQEETTEHNGTEVRIPVLEKDIRTFEKEMTKQLYYFENIIFEGFEEGYEKLANDYQIIRGKTFLFRGDGYNSNMHICLGRVAYPIDYDVLGLNHRDYQLPVALKLNVGDIGVTVSRESLDYSESTIKMLKKKLEEAKQEIKDLISKQYGDIKTLEQYFAVKNDFGKLEFKNGTSLYVDSLIKQSDVDFSNFKYNFMKMPNDKQLFSLFFEGRMYGKKPTRSRYGNNNTNFTGDYHSIKNKSNLVYVEGEFKRKIIKQAYLKDQHETYYIIFKKDITKSWTKVEINSMFNVALDELITEKGNPVKFVKTLLKMQEEYMSIIRKNVESYNELQIPNDFVASRKRGVMIPEELRKQNIAINFIGGYPRERINLSTLFDYNMPIFFGDADDERELRNAKEIYDTLFSGGVVSYTDYQDNLFTNKGNEFKNSIMFIRLAKNNIKYMQYCKKAYHVSTFNAKMLYRKEAMVRQYFQTHEVMEKYKEIDIFYRADDTLLKAVNPKWYKRISKLHEYVNAIPEESKNDNISYLRNKLVSVYNLDNIKPTDEQLQIIKEIDKIKELHKKNENILKHISLPYNNENAEKELITILKRIMVFK